MVDVNELVNIFEFESLARQALSSLAYGYYANGANDEITLRENRSAFDRLWLRPRMLQDVSQIDTGVSLFGQTWATPFAVAPMAFNALAHPDGELGVARACQARKISLVHSTLASHKLEAVAECSTAPRWFQLYAYDDNRLNQRLFERAERAGYSAIVITVDVPVLGKRETELRLHFQRDSNVQVANLLADEMRDLMSQISDAEIHTFAGSLTRLSVTWADIARFRTMTRLPILLKGILRGDDAVKALDYGVDGIVVSNHGGRQLDTAISGISALSEVVRAVNGRVPILVDGGVRRGTDILKALALGAQAVLVGRPVLWGLGVGGQAGVERVFEILHDELVQGMALCGCAKLSDITPDLVVS